MNDSGRITIRPWKRSDAESLASVLSNQKLLKNLRDGIPYPYTKEDALEYIDAMLAADPQDTFAYAIDLDGRAVGSVGAFRQENIHSRSAELGYYLAEEHWGKGFMTEAVKMLCRKLFQETDLVRIFAGPFSYNLGSRGVLEQAGFVFEGILHGHAVKNDRILDVALYALVKKPEHVTVRRLSPEEIPGSLALTWEVFLQFEAPEYSEEGIQEFRRSLDDEERIRRLVFYGAFDGGQMVGTLCMREPQHIGGFFIRAEYQGKGIGTALFESMKADYEVREFTVNSSPYAVEIYQSLGFRALDQEQTVNGLRFTPMAYRE